MKRVRALWTFKYKGTMYILGDEFDATDEDIMNIRSLSPALIEEVLPVSNAKKTPNKQKAVIQNG